MSGNGMKSSVGNIQLKSYNDLFRLGDGGEKDGSVQEIALSNLFPFRNHPFKVLDDEKMQETVESVKEHGVLVPGIVRLRKEGGYELVSGHRRKRACELAGLRTMPVIVRSLDDDEAVLIMVDSNIQRENLLPSEKAWAYRMKMEAIKRKAGRPGRDNSGQVVQNLRGKTSVEIVAEDCGENYKQVQRYIRLTELISALLQMVDDRKVPFNTAVELSYLSQYEQSMLLDKMKELLRIPSLEQAKQMKTCSRNDKLNKAVLESILAEGKVVSTHLRLKREVLRRYFPMSYTQKQMEEVIFSLLEEWKKSQG